MDTTHGNKTGWPHKPDPLLKVRKVPADSVPFGDSISRNGRTVWAAYRADELIAIGATAPEARANYRSVMARRGEALAKERRAANGASI
jgi:hypothetical protein